MAWDRDILERQKDAIFLTKLLAGLYESAAPRKYHTLNINAQWGLGKTYFLTNWKQDLQNDFPVIYYNAWENDYTSDPLLSFMVEIESQLKKILTTNKDRGEIEKLFNIGKKLIKPTAALAASGAARWITGQSLDVISANFSSAMEESTEKGLEKDAGTIAIKAVEEALKIHKTKKKQSPTLKKPWVKLYL